MTRIKKHLIITRGLTPSYHKEGIALSTKSELIRKIEDRTARIGVVGLGYVGLPFAVEKAKVGFQVIGIEQNPVKAQKINDGLNYILDVKDEELRLMVQQGFLEAVTDFKRIPEMDVVVVCVPTPLTINLTPDLQYIINVTQQITPFLRKGQLVTLESTTYPGTTEEVMLPILEVSGLKLEEDFFLAHSPERVDPGNQRYTTKNTHKVVGGAGPESLAVAQTFYSQTIESVIPVSCAKAAELTKVFENTFRAVNIALVNELTLLCDRMNLNVWEVLNAAFTKPFGIMPFFPGPGVGGHCIPLDPHYLEWKAKELNFNTHFIALAGEINRKMPEYVRDKALRILNRAGIAASRAKILVIGIAYKKDIEDERESPALEVIKLLQAESCHIRYHDPFIPVCNQHGVQMESSPLTGKILEEADLVIIATDHSSINYQWLVNHAQMVFDTRNATQTVTNGRDKITLL
ncbi:MAG: nucleotide sugar dehydrogenase [Syntrophomonas sp.]